MNTKNITIVIGNSDNVLTQKEWSNFIDAVNIAIVDHYCKIYFAGGSPAQCEWQNYAYSIEVETSRIPSFKYNLMEIARDYRQDSIAYVEGDVEFIGKSSLI